MKSSTILITSCLAAAFSTHTEHIPAIPQYNQASTAKSVLSLHKALVDIPSVSGNEGTIARWLKDYLEALDYHVHLQELPSTDDTVSNKAKRYNLSSHTLD